MATVVIATPHGGGVRPEYYRRVLIMQGKTLQHQFMHVEVDLQVVGKARNVLVDEVLRNSDASVIWFIDNDVLVPEHAGVLIDECLQYGVVSGLYFNRHSPYTPQMYRMATRDDEKGMYEAIIKYPEQGLVQADATGAGCLLVRRDVLEKMRDFHRQRVDSAEAVIRSHLQDATEFEWLMRYTRQLSPWFEFLNEKGEDFYFCERARDAGYLIWVDVTVKCEHLTELPITEGHFKYLIDNKLLIRLAPDGTPIPQGGEDENTAFAPA